MPEPRGVRRVVTGHDEHGRAVFYADDTRVPQSYPGQDAAFVSIWTTATVPADNNDPTDGRERVMALHGRGGSAIRVVDMAPGMVSPMHRTGTIDYIIIQSGQLELELDDGATRLIGPGDIVVQRGTIHRWRNPSITETCRGVMVLIEAERYRHEGVSLENVLP
jgi:quercetin dioxygenase-like cupin family protein